MAEWICDICHGEYDDDDTDGMEEMCETCGRTVCDNCSEAASWDASDVRCNECWEIYYHKVAEDYEMGEQGE